MEEHRSGEIHIAEDVIATIASLSATDVKGVAGMSGGLTGGIADVLGKKNLSKGVKVEVKNQVVYLHLNLVLEYGIAIPDIAWEIQDKVKTMVETMTALKVGAVDIHVQAVRFPEESVDTARESS
ncbi:Asp23/Gls24 family envelope stress response protein [Anoxynatronum sibiricum]|uniref:Asp23/Gls24 family envelope stress response protein n=2 Tax=Anoxynatronum sibiricum TaxID=210623 RepID=A0ABU9VQ55_9CLOT